MGQKISCILIRVQNFVLRNSQGKNWFDKKNWRFTTVTPTWYPSLHRCWSPPERHPLQSFPSTFVLISTACVAKATYWSYDDTTHPTWRLSSLFFVGNPIAFKGWHKKPVLFLHSGSPLVVGLRLHRVTYSPAIGLTICGLFVVWIVTIQCSFLNSCRQLCWIQGWN